MKNSTKTFIAQITIIDDMPVLSDDIIIDVENKIVHLAPGVTKERFIHCYLLSIIADAWDHVYESKESMLECSRKSIHFYDDYTFISNK